MTLPRFPTRHVHNAHSSRDRPYGPQERRVLNHEAFRAAKAEIGSWPGYRPTPLVALPGLARALGLASVHYKDEGQRFGLKSFKALGGAYAVLGVLQRHLAERHAVPDASASDLLAGRHGPAVAEITVAAATDGNHGRSVAWGAAMFGCACVIYLHEHVSPAREREIARYGARIVRVPGHYDDSVRACAADAAANGWVLVADTAGEADAAIPAAVMQGYTLLAQEILDELPRAAWPTHVFVQAGVGGLAAAVAAHWWELLGPARPRIVVVEPTRADCLFRTVAAGRPVAVEGSTETFMACLAAGEVSAPAWVVLRHAADDVLALEDEAAADTMRLLAEGIAGDPPLVSGESGSAAAAGLIAAAQDAELRRALALDPSSRVVAIGSEGATDAETYERVVGRSAEAVAAGRPRGAARPMLATPG
jgi:diaminopropionate ammonia-lyase